MLVSFSACLNMHREKLLTNSLRLFTFRYLSYKGMVTLYSQDFCLKSSLEGILRRHGYTILTRFLFEVLVRRQLVEAWLCPIFKIYVLSPL